MVNSLYWINLGLIAVCALVYLSRRRRAIGIYLIALLAGSLLQGELVRWLWPVNQSLALQIYEVLTIVMCGIQVGYVFMQIGIRILDAPFMLAILGGLWGFGIRAAMRRVSVYSTEVVYLFTAIFVAVVLFAFYRSLFGWRKRFKFTDRDWELVPLFIYSMVYISTYRFLNLDIDNYYLIQALLLLLLYGSQMLIGLVRLLAECWQELVDEYRHPLWIGSS